MALLDWVTSWQLCGTREVRLKPVAALAAGHLALDRRGSHQGARLVRVGAVLKADVVVAPLADLGKARRRRVECDGMRGAVGVCLTRLHGAGLHGSRKDGEQKRVAVPWHGPHWPNNDTRVDPRAPETNISEREALLTQASAEDSVFARGRGTDGEVGKAGVRRVQREYV